MLCVTVFVVTATVVYLAGLKRFGVANQYAATATIVQPFAAGTARLDPESTRRQLLTDDNLRRVLADPAAVVKPEELEPIRQQLQVTCAPSSIGGRVLTIRYTGGDADRVRRLVNGLAMRFGQQHAAQIDATFGKASRQAHAATEEAERAYQQARSQLSDFLERQIAAEPPAAEPSVAPPLEPVKPSVVDNPQWLEIKTQLDTLKDQRQQLLVNRTPLHPEVLALDERIAETSGRLAAIPRQTPLASTSPVSEPPAAPPAQTEPERPSIGQELLDLQAAVRESRERYDQCQEAERITIENQKSAPKVELRLADKCSLVADGRIVPRIAFLALAAAAAMAIAAGIIASGANVDPLLMTLAEVEAASPVPVVGVLPAPQADGPPNVESQTDGAASGGRMIVVGTLLALVCVGAVTVALVRG